MKKRVIRLNESQLVELIKKVIKEQEEESFDFESLSDEELAGLNPFWKLVVDEEGNKMVDWATDKRPADDIEALGEFLQFLGKDNNKVRFDNEFEKRGIEFKMVKEKKNDVVDDTEESEEMLEHLNKFKKMSDKRLIELNPSWRLIERDGRKIIKSAINESTYSDKMDKFIDFLGKPGVRQAYEKELDRRKISFTPKKKK